MSGVVVGAAPAHVAMGGNLGSPADTVRSAVCTLASLGVVERRSALYRTAPVGGPPGQAPYLNAVVVLRPWDALSDPATLLAALLHVERLHGRVRRERWGARVLDLDLLDLGGRTMERPGVTLPHPRMMERGFVLAPLCDVAPDWCHPVTGESAGAALARVGTLGVERTGLPWHAR